MGVSCLNPFEDLGPRHCYFVGPDFSHLCKTQTNQHSLLTYTYSSIFHLLCRDGDDEVRCKTTENQASDVLQNGEVEMLSLNSCSCCELEQQIWCVTALEQ